MDNITLIMKGLKSRINLRCFNNILCLNNILKRRLIFPFLLFSSISIFSQPVVNSLTYNTPDQQALEVNFNEAVTTTTGITGWTVRINGVVQAILGPSGNGTNYWIFLLPTPVKCGQAVTVQYNGTGNCRNAANQQLAAFGPSPAVNNVVVSCSMLSGVQGISVDALSGPCAPVTVTLTVFWEWSPQARNSINFNPARVRARINWTPTDLVNYNLTETAVCSGKFSTTQSWTYPAAGTECVYTPESFPYYLGPPVAMCNGGSATLRQSIVSYNTDALATGILQIVPDTIFICKGQSFNETFADATLFNCRKAIEPVRPNIEERYVQYIYGTSSTGNEIPNVSVNGNPVTDNAGNPISYPTPSGFYEGPVVIYDSADVPFPNMISQAITHAGNYANDQVNDIFEITIRNWGPCNPYNFGFGTPVITQAYLKIITAPPAPDASNQNFCFGAVGPLTATGHVGGTLTWYSDVGLTIVAGTGSPFNHGRTAVGNYNYWVTESQATCEGPATMVTLNIVQNPNQPLINVTAGSPSFCYDGVSSVTLTANPQAPPAVTSYQWYRDGNPVGGATGVSITLSTVAQSGSYTVRSYGSAPTFCQSPASAATAISVYARATTTNPTNQTVCEDPGTATFTVTTGGAAHTMRWQVSTNGGSTWANVTDGGVYSGATTATLTLTNAPYSYDNYQYRMSVTTTAGGCVNYSNAATLIVNPRPVVNTQPVSTSACENGTATFSVVASIPEGSISSYAWQRRIPASTFTTITAAMDGGIYSNFTTSSLLINPVTETINNYSYRVTISSAAGCGRNSNSVTIAVNLLADITTHPQNTSVCQNGNTSFTVATDGSPAVTAYQWQVSTNGGSTWNNVTPSAVYQNPTSQTLGLVGTPLGYNNYQYRVILTTNGPCPITSNTGILTVNPVPTANITPDPVGELCNGDIRNLNGNPAGGTPGYTHAWTGTGAAYLNNSAIQTPVLTAPSIGSQTTYSLIYTVTDTRGCQGTDNVSAIVNPLVTVNITRDIAGEVCSGTVIQLDGNAGGGTPAFTHLWTGSGITYLNATNIETPVFTSPAVGVQTSYSLTYTVTDTKGCGNSQTINIIVNPNPTANVTLSDNGPLCYNETSIANGNAAGGTPAYSHQWTGTGSGFLSATNIQTPTFTAPSIGVLINYTLNYRVTDSKGCQATSSRNLIVYPHVQNAVLSGDTSICSGQPANLRVVITGGVGPYNVQLRDDLNNPLNANPYTSGNPISTGNLAATRSYTIFSVTDANGCPATVLVGNPTVTVGAALLSAILSGGAQICYGSAANLRVAINGGAPPFSVVINGYGTVNNYTSGANINLGVLTVGTHTYNLTSVTDACSNTISGAAVSGGNPQNVVVNAIPDASGTTNNTPAICSNGTTDIVLQSTVPLSDFIWTVANAPAVTWSGGKAPVGGTRINGIGTSIAQNLQHTATFPTTVTYTITPRGPGATACLGTPITRNVIVNPTAQVNDPADQVRCNGSATAAVNFGTVNTGGTTTYAWSNNNTSIGLAASGTGNIASFTGTNAGTSPITGTITVTPTYTNGGVSCTGPVQTFTITVNPTAQVNDPADQVVCNGSPTTAVTFGTNRTGGATTYAWTNNTISIGLAASGTGNIASFTATNAGTAPVTATITVTPTFTNGGQSCPGTAQTFTITVNPSAQVNDPADQVVCNGNPTTAVTFGTNRTGGATTYAWTNNNTSINLAASGTGNIASFTATNAGTAPVTATITVTPTFSNGGASCPGTAQTFTITVNPSAQVNDPADQVVCNNSPTTAVNFGTNRTGGTTAYAWTNNNTSINLAASGTGNIASFTATNAGTAPVTATITVTPTFTNGGASCPGTVQTFMITVNPSAQVNDPADQIVCNNSPTTAVTFGTNRTGGSTTYAWTNNNTSINLAASGTGNIASFTATNAGTAAVTATITVTPTFTNGGTGCPGTVQTFTITVNPTPTLNSSLTPPDICSNTAFSYLPTSATGSTTFNWTRNIIAGITPAGPTSGVNNPNETLRNRTSTTIAVTYTYSLSANGCPNTQNVVVNIKSEPVITPGQNPSVCSNVALNYEILLDNFDNPGDVVNFTWPLPAIDPNIIGGNARPAPSNANITDVFTNVSGSLGTATYTVTPTYNGCTGDIRTVVINVGAQPVLADLNDEACSDVSIGLILDVAVGSVPAANYDITAVSVNPSLNIISQAIIPQAGVADTYLQNDTYRNLTGGDLTVVYTVVPVFSPGCAGNAKTITITIHPEPIILLGQTKTICNNEPANMQILLNPANTPAGSEFRWNKPTMNDGSDQGTARSNVAADPAGTIHITDAFINAPAALPYVPITATYYVTPTSSFGCDGDQIPVVITINPKPNTSAISGPDETCVNTTNMVYSVTPTGGSRYYWYVPPSLGAITFGGTVNDAFFIMNAAGAAAADSISVIERNSFTCWGDTVKFGLEIFNYPPLAVVAGDNSVCAGEAGMVYSVPNNAGSVYSWSVPIGTSITSFPVTQNQITVTFGSINGNISVVETNQAGCVTNHTPLNVTVNPLPSPTITPGKALICLGEAVTFTAGPAGAANYTFFVDGVQAQDGAARTYITDSLTNGQGVTVEVTLASGCFNTSTASYVIVSDPPVVTMVSSDADNRICSGTSVTFTASSLTATSFEFRLNGIAQQSGASKTWVTSSLVNGDIVSVIGTTAFGCNAPGNNITTQVDPLPAANFTGTATICEGSTTNLAVNVTTGTAPYQIQVNQGVGTISPYNSGAVIPVTPGATTTYTLLSITDANSCTVSSPSPNITGQPIVTILEDINISVQPIPVTNCPGASVSFSVLATGASPACQWRRNGTNLANDGRITGVLTANLNIANISVADAGNYDVVVSGSCQPDTSNAVALTVQQNIQITGQPVNVVECPGETVQFGVVATGTNPAYRWRKNGSPLSDGGSISGSDTDTLTISNINSFTAGTYDVVVTGTCAPATSNPATLTINVQPYITAEPTSKIICEGGNTSFTVNAGLTTGPVYHWQVDDGGGFDTITAVPYAGYNTNTLTVSPAASSMNGYRYRVLVSGACNPPVTSVEVTLTVRENPEIITPPADSTVCEGSSVAFTVDAGVTTTPTYTWEVYNGSIWSTITGAPYSGYNTTTLGLFNATSAFNNYRYRVTVSGACNPPVLSAVATLTVNEKPEVTVQPVTATECEDGTVIFSVNAGVTTAPAYQWQEDAGAGFTNVSGVIYSGGNTSTLTVNPITSPMNGYRYRAVISGTCTPDAISNPAQLVVREKPEITLQPSSRIICENDNTQFTVNPGVTTNPSFQWQYNTGSGWNPAPSDAWHSGALTNTLSITGALPAMTTWQYRVVVSGTCAPSVTSNAAILTVNQRPEIIVQPVDAVICEDANTSFTVNAGVTTSPTYQWQVSTGGPFGNIFGGIYSGENTATLNITGAPSTMNGYIYRVIVGGTCTPAVTSNTAILTVNQKPEVTVHPIDRTICEGDNTTFSVNAGVTTNPAYQWEVDMGGGFNPVIPGPEYSGINSNILNIIGGTSAMNNFQYRAVISGTCLPNATSNAAILTVRERPEIITQPRDSAICEGSAVTFNVDAGVTTGVTYQWQVDPNTGTFVNVAGALYSGQTTSTLNIFNVPSSYNGYRYHVIVSGTCPPAVTSNNVALTVRERPEITGQPVNTVICEDGTTQFIVNAGVTTSPLYVWEVNDGGGFDIIAGAPYLGYTTNTLTVNPVISTMNSYSYRVTVSGTCAPPVTSGIVFLTVDEKPEIISDPQDTAVCEGQGTVFSVYAGVTTNPTYLWEVNDGGGWVTATGGVYINQTTPNLGLTTTNSAMNGYRYRVTVSGKCAPAVTSAEAVLTIRERPEVTVPPNSVTECEDGTVNFTVNAGVTTSPAYQWQVDQGFGFFNVSGGIYAGETTSTLTATGITSVMNNYRYRAVVSGTCTPSVNSASAILTINEKPEVTWQPVDKTICEDGNTLFRINPGVTTAPTFLWEYNTGAGWNPVPSDAWHSGLTNDTLFITGAISAMNGWQYRAVVSGTCIPSANSNAAILTIDEKPEIAIQPVDSAICENANAVFVVDAGVTTNPIYQWQVDPKTGTFSNVSGGFYAGGTTPVLNVVGAISTMNGYRYRVIIGGTCTPTTTSNTVTLTVYEKPEVTLHPVAKTICEGDNTFFRVNAGVTTNPAYQWEVDQGSGFNPVAAGPEYSGINDDTLQIIGGTSAMDNWQYRAVISGTCAPDANSNPAILTVRERPEIISQPVDSTICEGSSASFTVDAGVTTSPSCQWQVDKNTGSFVNVSGAGYSGQTTSMLNIFNAPSTWNGYRYRVVISGSCTPSVTSDTVILTVLQRPEIIGQPANAIVCEDGSTLFTVNPGVTTNPTFIWLVDEGSGYDTITGGIYTGFNTATLNVSTTSSIMNGYLYKVTVGGTCTPEVTSSEVLLTIDEKPEVILDPADTTVCEGTGAAFFIDAGVTTNPVFKWQVNTGAAWTDVSGAPYMGQGTSSLLLTNTTSAMNNYRYRAIVSGKCTPAATSAEAALNIYEKPEVTVHPVDRTECEGGSVIYFVNPGVTTNPTFQWQVDKGSGFNDITDLNYSGINNDTLTVSNITSVMHGYRYRVIVSGTCAPADAISNPARLYVNEKPEVTQHPASMTVCENDNAYFSVNPGVTTAPTFQWQYSSNNGVTWNPVPAALPYSGITNDTLFISGATIAINNYQYRAIVSGTCTPTATSNPGILTVRIRPVITLQPPDRIICENDNTTFTVNAGSTTNPTYQWQVDQGSGFNNAGGSVYSGVTTATLTLTNVPSSMNGFRYQVIVSGACTPSATSNIVTLTVYEKPEVMSHPAAVTVCEDGDALFTVNPGVTTSPAYQWQVDQGGGFIPVPFAPPYTGANNDSLLITGVTGGMNNYRYRVIINGTCTPAATSNNALLTVRQKPEIISHPTSQMICEDGSTSFSVDAGVTTNPTYQWQMDPNTGTFINVSGGFYSGQNSATLNITGALSAMNGYRYQVIVGGYCSPAVTSNIAVLNINEKPEVKRQPVNQTVCEGSQTYFAIDAGVTTNPTYQWQVDDGGGFDPIIGGPYSGMNTDSLVITAVSSAMQSYMFRVVVSGTCTPSYTSFPALLFVSEKPEVTESPADTIVCENSNAAFFVNAGVTTNPTYRWQVNTGTGFNNISDGGKYIGSTTSKLSIFNATAVMNGYTYRVVIGGTCAPQINSPAAALTVNTKPAITGHPNDATICEGNNTSFSVTANGTFLTYEWQVDKNDGNGYAAISNGGVYSGATTATLQITGASRTYNNYNYRVIVNGTCAPAMTSNIARLMVNTPPEILTEPAPSTICEFNNTSFFVVATGGGISYQWQENDGTGFRNLVNSGNYIGTTSASLNIFNISRSMNGYRYRVLIGGTCSPNATSAVVILTVNTKPEILAQPVDTTVCETLPLQFCVSAQGTSLIYQWQEDGGGGFTDIINGGKYSGATSACLMITNPTPLMTGYRYRVYISGTCPSPVYSDFRILTVNTFPAITTQPENKEICENGVTAFISNASGTGISYQWQEDSGSGFVNLTDGGVYNGATTTTLTISNAPVSLNGNSYRLQVVGACAPINSGEVDLIVNANPTVGITGDSLVCGGLDLNLDGSPAGGSGTYTHSWTGDVFPLTSINTQTTVFNTVAPGSYNLTYTVTDSKGCKASDVTVITNERPQVQYISDAKPSCGILTVNFTNQSTGAVTYEWNFNDPSAPGIVTDVNPSHDFTNFTPQIYYYNVSLVGLSPNGCGDTMRQVVTLYPSIDASFSINPVDGCNPVTASLDAIPGGSTYFWNFDDGNAEYGGASATHQFINTTGNTVVYTVELTTTSFYGCTDTKTADITVYPLPIVDFSADPAFQQYPAATVTFTNLTPAGSWTYIWQYGDGNTSTDVSPVYTYAAPGEYNVRLTAQTAECIDSIIHKITIVPAAPVADFSPPETGCAPLEITFDNQSQFGTSFIWDFGNGSQSSKQNPTFTYYEAGIYAVKLIVYGPGGTDNITRFVTVKQTPVAYSNVAPTFVFVNDVPIKCFNLSTDTVNPVYLWDFGDHNTSDEFEPVHVYTEPGRYDVTLTVTNDNECSDEYIFSYVEVEPAGQVIFPNVFKPNPDGPSGGEYRPGEDNNEIFFPGVYDQVAEYELVIYNRWGEMIFISKDVNIGWDGYIKDKLAEQGVYIWRVKVKYANGKVENLAGDITLLR